MKRVLLLHMPLAVPNVPSLAVELLSAILQQNGIPCDTFYGTTRFRRTPQIETFIHGVPGEVIFTPLFYRDLGAEMVARQMVECREGAAELKANLDGFAKNLSPRRAQEPWPVTRRQVGEGWPYGSPDDSLLADLLTHMDVARLCIEQCLAEIPENRYDVFGFSVSFDSQRMASLALAQRLKEREPDAKIVFGGTACDGDMGEELIERFPFVDAVGQGDADLSIVQLVRALRGQTPLAFVPGIIYRKGDRLHRTLPAPPLESLDSLPIPDYTQFLEQLEASEWRSELPLILYEASRGCWWGEKHHCKFCGLRADGLTYRRKSAERTRAELDTLARRHPVHYALYATDAILDYRYLKEFFPTIKDLYHEHRWKLFFEIKSNLKKEEVALLAETGVKTVQPGIESFSDHVLKMMDKGSTGSRQVQLLRWLNAYKINIIYNFIIGTPGETAEDYEETLEAIPLLMHLPPPTGVHHLNLDRFSPYFKEPERYGIYDAGPDPTYSIIYQDSAIDVSRLAYKYRHRSAEHKDPALRKIWNRLTEAVDEWRDSYNHRRFWMVKEPDRLLLVRHDNGERTTDKLEGLAAELYYFCDTGRSFGEIRRAFPAIAECALRACLRSWCERRWMFHFRSDCYLSLAVEVEPTPLREEAYDERHVEALAIA